jgi:hypothetical protein
MTVCWAVLSSLSASQWIRDQSTPVALTFDFHSVVTRISMPISATRVPSPASRAAAHHRVHVGLTTPYRAGREEEGSKPLTKGEAAAHSRRAKSQPTHEGRSRNPLTKGEAATHSRRAKPQPTHEGRSRNPLTKGEAATHSTIHSGTLVVSNSLPLV